MKYLLLLLASPLMVGYGTNTGAAGRPPETPFSDESLVYSVSWPKGLNLGQAQMVSTRAGDRWRFAFSLDAAVMGFVVSDSYQSVAADDFCSAEFVKTYKHGNRKAGEKETFDAKKGTATRQTLGKDAGKSEISAPGCAKDALTFLYYLRRELAQGRVPASQTVFFGAPYQLTLERGGKQKVRVRSRSVDADLLRASVKGPASETKFEMLFAQDAVRTPVLIRLPLALGTFSLELVR